MHAGPPPARRLLANESACSLARSHTGVSFAGAATLSGIGKGIGAKSISIRPYRIPARAADANFRNRLRQRQRPALARGSKSHRLTSMQRDLCRVPLPGVSAMAWWLIISLWFGGTDSSWSRPRVRLHLLRRARSSLLTTGTGQQF